jgi:hypothetical protein
MKEVNMPTVEERLAALETKLAALTETTPTTYYEHQYSGEEIDNAVARALPNGAIDQAAGTFVRPNLLDNWYFGRPVNQRGKSEYTGSGYTVDRWTAKEGVVSLSSGGLTLQNSTWLDQIIENLIENRIYTISLLTANGVLLAGTGLLNKDSFISVRIDGGGYIDISYHADVSGYYVELARADAAQPLSILAAKLELGPTQTLAHREGDRWALNEVPDYGEQLRRCQRYYIKYDTIKANGYISNAAKSYYMPIFLPEALRTTPTILGTPKIRVRFNGGYSSKFVGGTFTAPDSWGVTAISANAVTLAFNVNTAVDPNNIPVSIEVEGLELSAEL